MIFENMIGLGVAGNFAGHLEQAGEAADFKQVNTAEPVQPKAIFPFYVPAREAGFLSVYPLSSDILRFPAGGADNLQIEPEIALICDLQYENKKVVKIIPHFFAAYNDCSIRRPNARKICEKKNWGLESKGLAKHWIPLPSFEAGSVIDRYRIACFHRRDGKTNIYGVDSPALGYSYFHQKLLDWIAERMNNQRDQGPINDIAQLLAQANYPDKAVISIGATRYTPFGEQNYLQPGDTSIVAVYNGEKYDESSVFAMAETLQFAEDISVLIQNLV
ncbi:hypothetical protein EDC45_1939 [Mesocricetibacter intestinalis]|uniref:Uncharacterized protein n=1 Tax=Mesocricetibacter intestinalis TaxID=1521930 RepID=A0A4R6VG39_9PAST|nr:DUF5718 family protein [Mesocricetibacter intestinalis]TDQ56534.1 hypothetical protein EDC45_1939 [Mesocricetibacter intestinalis]